MWHFFLFVCFWGCIHRKWSQLILKALPNKKLWIETWTTKRMARFYCELWCRQRLQLHDDAFIFCFSFVFLSVFFFFFLTILLLLQAISHSAVATASLFTFNILWPLTPPSKFGCFCLVVKKKKRATSKHQNYSATRIESASGTHIFILVHNVVGKYCCMSIF